MLNVDKHSETIIFFLLIDTEFQCNSLQKFVKFWVSSFAQSKTAFCLISIIRNFVMPCQNCEQNRHYVGVLQEQFTIAKNSSQKILKTKVRIL